MTHDPNAWDTGLEGLLDAERRNVSAPGDAEERLWAKVAAGIAIAPVAAAPGHVQAGHVQAGHVQAGHAQTGLELASSAVTAGAYVLGIVTGVVGSVIVMHASAPRPVVAKAAPMEVVRVEREVAPPPTAVFLDATADPSPPAPARAPIPIPARSATVEHTLSAEQVLLDQARSALGRGDGEQALRATTTHAQRYPQGSLSEEREAIAIQALLLVQRYDDAKQREASFERQYPHSMLLQAVRASIASIP